MSVKRPDVLNGKRPDALNEKRPNVLRSSRDRIVRGRKWEPKQTAEIPRMERVGDDLAVLAGIGAVAALPVIAAGALAVGGAAAAAKAVRTWRNYRPPRWKLLKCPSPEAVNAQWQAAHKHRDPLAALRFGALLLNVSQHVDCTPIYGRGKHIVARNPGLKGWLRENGPEIVYVTAMSYRKLAEVACRAIGLPEFLPLDWVLPGTEAQDAAREFNPEKKFGMKLKRAEFLRQIKLCREKLARLLEGAGSVNQLYAALDAATQGHRHRASRKTMGADSRTGAAGGLCRHLRTALETLEGMPPDKQVSGQATLLALLDDLKRRLESRSASA